MVRSLHYISRNFWDVILMILVIKFFPDLSFLFFYGNSEMIDMWYKCSQMADLIRIIAEISPLMF